MERLLTRLGMSGYYGSEGFGRGPAAGRVLVRCVAAPQPLSGGYFGDDGAGA